MKYLLPISLMLALSACGGKTAYEACTVSDMAEWEASQLNYAGGQKAPGRDGMNLFNKVVPGEGSKRASEFEMVFKTNAAPDTQCVATQLTCAIEGETWCQEFNCTVELKNPALGRVIDAQNTYYFKTDTPTIVNWDGKKLGCKAP